MKIGILREGKVPIDRRVALTPEQASSLVQSYKCEIVVQPSSVRAIDDTEYTEWGIPLQEDLSDCDVLFGVKEVPIQLLIPSKTYFFFSHTYKKQPYNAKLLNTCVDKKIRLIDYELLTKNGARVVAFGRFAGLVGAYNGLRGWGEKYGQYRLKPAHECKDKEEMFAQLQGIEWPSDVRILLTGKGRVAGGAVETLKASGIPQIAPDEVSSFEGCFWSQLDVEEYYQTNDGRPFDRKELFRIQVVLKVISCSMLSMPNFTLLGIITTVERHIFSQERTPSVWILQLPTYPISAAILMAPLLPHYALQPLTIHSTAIRPKRKKR